MSTATIAERVARGAALLDREKPGWAARINERELNLGCCADCILGQVYGDYHRGRDALGLGVEPFQWTDKHAAEHGFHHVQRPSVTILDGDWEAALEAESAALDAEYADLATAWLAEIRARLAPPVPMVDPLHVAAMVNCPEMVP